MNRTTRLKALTVTRIIILLMMRFANIAFYLLYHSLLMETFILVFRSTYFLRLYNASVTATDAH